MPKSIKWSKLAHNDYRAFPDRRHVLLLHVVRTDDGETLYHWRVCLGHERNVLAEGDSAFSLGEKSAQRTCAEAYAKVRS